MKPTLIQTADGSHTLYLHELDEQYHSVNGAMTESDYVFIQKGYSFHTSQKPVILEVGFGTGLNALMTALSADKENRKTVYYSLEKYPLENEIVKKLNYGKIFSGKAEEVFQKIHSCSWGKMEQITSHFQLCKLKLDLTKDELNLPERCHVVYFDAFAPDKQAEMWTPAIFGKIFDQLLPGGVFVTYSAKGEVRRQLTAAGFDMERLPGPPGKNEMLRGIKVISNI